MIAIAEFLLARIAEDEAIIREGERRARRLGVKNFGGSETWLPDDIDGLALSFPRALAECQAKRAIIEEHGGRAPSYVDVCNAHDANFETIPCDTLLHLATIYADHPDYQQEWKP